MHKFISPLALAVLAAPLANAAFAFDRPNDWRWHHHHDQDHFGLGVCVGQTLAAQGVTLPTPQAGQPPVAPDATTQQAIEAAIQTCRAQFTGAGPSPSPSPDPSATPMPTPTPSASSDPTTTTSTTGSD